MSKQARVTSIDAIREFKAALEVYQETVADCLDSLAIEVRRGLDWFQSDRMSYWPAQVRESSDCLTEAQNALERKQLTFGTNERPSATEEKQAVENAKRRRQYCEQRLANSKRWLRVISHDAEEFKGLIAKVNNLTTSDLPQAIATLERLASALDKYTRVQIPNRTSSGSTESSPLTAPEPKTNGENE